MIRINTIKTVESRIEGGVLNVKVKFNIAAARKFK